MPSMYFTSWNTEVLPLHPMLVQPVHQSKIPKYQLFVPGGDITHPASRPENYAVPHNPDLHN